MSTLPCCLVEKWAEQALTGWVLALSPRDFDLQAGAELVDARHCPAVSYAAAQLLILAERKYY
jgi:hypothetical protein